MKEIKAYVRQSRIAGVLQAIREVGVPSSAASPCWQNIAVSQVMHPLTNHDPVQQHYSMELAEPVISFYRIEFTTADDSVASIVQAITRAAHTGQPDAGWMVVTDVQLAEEIS